MAITKSINNVLKKIIEQYSQRIIDEKDIKAEELENIWSEFSDDFSITLTDKKTLRCKYVYKKGTREGEVCGKCIKEGEYCYLHRNKDKSTNVVLYKYENSENFIHKETQFIFKDVNKNRIVIGKLIGKTIKDLEESDIKECKKWKFKYDKSKS